MPVIQANSFCREDLSISSITFLFFCLSLALSRNAQFTMESSSVLSCAMSIRSWSSYGDGRGGCSVCPKKKYLNRGRLSNEITPSTELTVSRQDVLPDMRPPPGNRLCVATEYETATCRIQNRIVATIAMFSTSCRKFT